MFSPPLVGDAEGIGDIVAGVINRRNAAYDVLVEVTWATLVILLSRLNEFKANLRPRVWDQVELKFSPRGPRDMAAAVTMKRAIVAESVGRCTPSGGSMSDPGPPNTFITGRTSSGLNRIQNDVPQRRQLWWRLILQRMIARIKNPSRRYG